MLKRFWDRLTLNQKLVLPFLTICLSLFMLGLVVVGYWFTKSLEQNLRLEVAAFADRVQQDFVSQQQDLGDQIKLIADSDDLRTALESRNPVALRKVLLPIKAALGFDWVKVVDTDGHTWMNERAAILTNAQLSEGAISNSASAGANLTDLVLANTNGTLQALLTANYPIKLKRLLGGLILGRLVSDDLLQEIAAGSSKQLVALVGDQVVATTLAQRQLPFQIPTADQAALRVTMDHQPYLAKKAVLGGAEVDISMLVLYPMTALETAKRSLWIRLGLLFLLSSTVVSCLGVGIARTIVRPIYTLTQMTQRLAQGDASVRVQGKGQDEIGQLGRSFNQLAEQLAERGVLSQKIQFLQQTLHDLEKNQSQLIHTEKMSSLGQLVAGIAHEINTPLGAIQSSISNITSALDQALKDLPPLMSMLSPNQLSDFFALLALAQQAQEPLSFREERQLKRALRARLTEQGVDQADVIAERLSRMGITADLDPILPLLRDVDVTSILETAYQLSIVQNNSQNIQLAVDRAARIVYALKNYVRQDQTGIPIYASVTEGIDTVLALYQNQIKHGIQVSKQYDSLPPILCYPEELVQVWSNLISNAIHAMEHQGQLAIATTQQGQHIMVKIMDSGHGIPLDIQAKIFDPFFTTKVMGEGTGLGLNIVKNIIVKHHGSIDLASEPGQTVFRIWLPIAPPN